MRSLVRWATHNSPAMNTLMVTILVIGGLGLSMMRREVFPEFDLEIILISVPYPGASPSEVEEGICLKIEEAVRSVSGIKKQTSVAQEGAGFLVLELESDVPSVQKILSEVRSEVDRIPSFPVLAEDPEVKQITLREPAIKVGVIGPESDAPDAELRLREITEKVRDELLMLPAVSQANIIGARDYEIDIEIPERTLRKYGLTLQEVARIVRRENLELPGGSIRTPSQTVLLRGKNKGQIGKEIAKLPLVTESNGVVLTVGDLGEVRDEFTDSPSINRINGHPGMVISVDRTSKEDLLAMVEAVKSHVESKNSDIPSGYHLETWSDRSVEVRDRLELLRRNGTQGLVLVFLVLAIFLELRLAMWVALGIPVAILGACGVLLFTGQTLNMLSMFAFLMALGIVVDDAIVIGENIYAHRQAGKRFVQAAIDGTAEVIPSVAASVGTTIIAFCPLFYVAGVMGKFIAVMPLAVIAMLVISLVESIIILPCHLAHSRPAKNPRGISVFFLRVNHFADRKLTFVIERVYRPTIHWCLENPATVLSISASILIVSLACIRAGIAPFILFPKIDSNQIFAKVIYPDGTPSRITEQASLRLEQAIDEVNRQLSTDGQNLVVFKHLAVGSVSSPGALGPDTRTTGGHVGNVSVELIETSQRDVTSQTILAAWRKAAGEFPGADSVTFGTPDFGPGGRPIEFKLLAPAGSMKELEEAVDRTKVQLGQYRGVFDITDDSRPGKWEFQLQIDDKAKAMGVSLADLAETVRASYYGEEVMRLQRGRHEVKLMVRYPRDERRSLANFGDLQVRTGDGSERPLTELARVNVVRGYSEINRINQLRSITITADVDEATGNAKEVVSDLQQNFVPELLQKHPGLSVRWEGQQEQTNESIESLKMGFAVATLCMFALLTVEFRSYLQPLIILVIIPFGGIGAIWGHVLLGLPVTLFSMFGLVALTGVIVNDSIVLVDFINHHLGEGKSLKNSLIDAGVRRFRPVMLTSVTTVAGLLPLLLEKSFQAQILIPMAASLVFGLMLSTILVLFLVPTFYHLYARLLQLFGRWNEELGMQEFAQGEQEEGDQAWMKPTNGSSPAPKTADLNV